MQIIPYIQSAGTIYYSPAHYQSSRSFTLESGKRILVTLYHHEQLGHVIISPVGGKKSATWHGVSQDKVGLLVTNDDSSMIFVQKNTTLNVLLNLKNIISHFVILSDNEKIQCICQLPPYSPEEEEDDDSCHSGCDHSDIEDVITIS